MKKFLAILHRPYPLEDRKLGQLKQAIIFGLAVFVVLFLINVFNNNYKASLLNGLIAGFFTFAIIEIDYLFFFNFFPNYFKEERWTIGKEIIWATIIIVSIASINLLVTIILGKANFSFYSWMVTVFYTFLIGIFPVATSILINQTRLLKKYKQEAIAINKGLNSIEADKQTNTISIKNSEPLPAKDENKYLVIEAENEKDNLFIDVNNFLAATSADNYVKLFFLSDNNLTVTILRTTLKKIETNSLSFPEIFRCHRTAIVNLAAVQNLQSSAQGYKLKMAFLQEEIPVSRSLNKLIKEKITAIRPLK